MLSWLNCPQPKNIRFLLLDRDGVLNENRPDYVKSLEEVSFYQDALEALKYLHSKDIGVILISNQSGINRGLITWSDSGECMKESSGGWRSTAEALRQPFTVLITRMKNVNAANPLRT